MIMKFWIAVDECTGCSACESVCLRNAIIMKENEYDEVGAFDKYKSTFEKRMGIA